MIKIEIHILWAQHQVHHSSEDFNLGVGLRQSIFHAWCGFVSISYTYLYLLTSKIWYIIYYKIAADKAKYT